MSKRIRYKQHPTRPECKISIQAFTSKGTGAKYRIVINEEEDTFHIRNEKSKEFVFNSEKQVSKVSLKYNARKKLQKFGVPLSRESRDRTFGLCKEGYSQKEHEDN